MAEKLGMYKSDVCRLAQLFLNGGYYFDNDVEPFDDVRGLLNCNVGLTSVISLQYNNVFQAFLGSTPGHPLIELALNMTFEYYAGRRMLRSKWMGPDILKQAYTEMVGLEILKPGYDSRHGIHMFVERPHHKLQRY